MKAITSFVFVASKLYLRLCGEISLSTREDWERKAREIPKNCSPDELSFFLFSDNNNLNGTIPWELSLLTSLQHLTMGRNNLRGAMPEAFGAKLARLDTLRLSQNRLSGTIPDTVGGFSEIKEIVLADNAFSGPIPPRLLRYSGLEILDISNNMLNGTIPDYQTHSTTKGINMANNLLTGTIPPSLTLLKQLSSLRLEWNLLSGVRHHSICAACSTLEF